VTTNTAATAAGIVCQKCHLGKMQATKVPRMSPAAQFFGLLLAAPAALVLAASAVIAALMFLASLGAFSKGEDAKATTVHVLNSMAAPKEIIDEFKRTGAVKTERIEALSPEMQLKVRGAIDQYHVLRSTQKGAPIVSGAIGWCGLVAAAVVAGPFLILGLLLLLNKRVWRCSNCGYFYDRA